jgi:dipeptidyl aminopeptidase/acylaminoacyl peptidase
MRAFIAAALAASLSFTSQSSNSQNGRPMTIDDLVGAVRVTDPQLSPDGSRVIFVRTTTDLKSGDRNADIWTVPSDGSGPAEGTNRRKQGRQHAALFAGRTDHRVHLDARRRATGC